MRDRLRTRMLRSMPWATRTEEPDDPFRAWEVRAVDVMWERYKAHSQRASTRGPAADAGPQTDHPRLRTAISDALNISSRPRGWALRQASGGAPFDPARRRMPL